MALSDGGSNIISQAVSTAIQQVNATRAAAEKQPVTDVQIRTALAAAENYKADPMERSIEPDLKRRIMHEKSAYNNLEAAIREVKAKVISGELLGFDTVEQIILDRIASAKSRLWSLGQEIANSLVRKTEDFIREKLTEKIALIIGNLPEWNIADFVDGDVVEDVITESEKELA